MVSPRLEFSEVRIAFSNDVGEAGRTERIARMTFHFLQERLQRELQHITSGGTINYLEVPAIEVSFEAMDDETIARLSAETIYRALLQVR